MGAKIFFCQSCKKKSTYFVCVCLLPAKSYYLSKNGLWKIKIENWLLDLEKVHQSENFLEREKSEKCGLKSQVKTSPTHKRAIIVYKWLQPFVLVQTSKFWPKLTLENGCTTNSNMKSSFSCNCLCFSKSCLI